MKSLEKVSVPDDMADLIVSLLEKEKTKNQERSFISVLFPRLALAAGFLLVCAAGLHYFSAKPYKEKIALKKDVKVAKAEIPDVERESGSFGEGEDKSHVPAKKKRLAKIEEDLDLPRESIPPVSLDASSVEEDSQKSLRLSKSPKPEIQQKMEEAERMVSVEKMKDEPSSFPVQDKIMYVFSLKAPAAVQEIIKILEKTGAKEITEKENEGNFQITARLEKGSFDELEKLFQNIQDAKYTKDEKERYRSSIYDGRDKTEDDDSILIVIEYTFE